nr:Chain L, G7-TEdFP peptide [synthetic construct]5D0J_M Chain M, G7-TEdFP peptide [synthetic construct]
SFEGYDNSC